MNNNNVDNHTRDTTEADARNNVISVQPEGNVAVLTQDDITFDDQTAIVRQQKKDNEKANTVACFLPKQIEFKNYLKEYYSPTQPTSWHLITEEKVKYPSIFIIYKFSNTFFKITLLF